MSIERIETALYRLPLEPMGDAGHGAIDAEEVITVRLHADGLVGHGYSYSIGRGGHAIKSLIDYDIAPLVAGLDPDDIDGIWNLLWQRLLFVGRGGLVAFGIAAVDIALWDLRGLRQQKPLYALLDGQARDVPVYGSGVDLPKSLPELLKQVRGFVAQGYGGVKVKIGRPAEEDTKRISAVRAEIGPNIDLMVDANMSFTLEQAEERGQHLSLLGIHWYEEPLVPEDVEGHAELARRLRIPIAVGESLHSPYEFKRYVEGGAVQVVQIDPVTNGGITASLRALQMADRAELPTSSHYTDELSAHLLCASRNPMYLEKHAFALDRYLQEPQRVADGRVRPTEVSGTGMRFDEAALSPYRTE